MYNKNNSKHETKSNLTIKNKFSIVLVIVLSLLLAFSTVGCKKNKNKTSTPSSEKESVSVETPRQDGEEAGVYYFDVDGEESLITLDGGKSFTYYAGGAYKTGKYTVAEDNLTLTFDKTADGQMTANLATNVLNVAYNGSQMRFYKKVNYSVTFDSKEGSAVPSATVLNGKTVVLPENPTRSGYVFAGWYLDTDCTTPINPSEAITTNTTYYANWVNSTPGYPDYEITFNYADGKTADTKATTVGGKLVSVETPTNGDYTFDGWWISDYEDASKLSYKYEAGMSFDEDTTLFALWSKAESGAKLNAPIVNVETNGVSWTSVGTSAIDYTVTIVGPSGYAGYSENLNRTSLAVDWVNQPAGDYVITVKANASNEDNNSETTTRYYKNKALSRVSSFSVIDPSTLIFDAVDNATAYYITVKCGSSSHAHDYYYLNNSTYFNFTNCAMTNGGIAFTVTAVADGYASSTSATYYYSRDLDSISNIYFDEATQTLTWDRVANATSYVVSVSCGNADHNHTALNIGNANTYNLKECTNGAEGIKFSVYPVTAGYNSPEATEYVYNKAILASPANVKVNDTVISWDAVEGADSYTLMIGNTVLKETITTTSYDVITAIQWVEGDNYKISVKANGATQSAWSDAVDMRYYAMYGTLNYSDGYVSWRPVIGAAKYEVSVNGSTAIAVNGGETEFKVTLDRAGDNVIDVRFIDGNGTSSAWATTTVYAYEIEFDTRGGAVTNSLYKAINDTLGVLPTSTKTGYILEGWYNAIGGADATAVKLTEKDVLVANGTLMYYAYWQAKEINVTFDLGSNGEWEEGTETEATVLYNSGSFKFSTPKVIDATYVFAGWSVIANDQDSLVTNDIGEAVEGYKWTFSEDTVLYACYVSEVFKFTLLNDHTYSVRKGRNANLLTTVTVPQYYDGLPVAVVDGYAFDQCYNIRHIKIPDTIKLIETSTAFARCTRLQSVDLYDTGYTGEKRYVSEDGVLIRLKDEESAIYSNRIDYVPLAKTGVFTMPEIVQMIPYQAFNNSLITEIYIPHTVTLVEGGAFYECKQLSTVKFLPAPGEYAEFLTIADDAFLRCTALTSVTLPKRTASLGFDEETKELTIFDDCNSLRALHIEAGNNKYGSIDGVLTTSKDSVTETNPYAIIYCPQARRGEYVVPAEITAINAYAFSGCINLTGITVHGMVSSIGKYAFYGCTNVTYVKFDGVAISGTTIGEYAFAKNTNLKTITYAEDSRVTVIRDGAFSDCTSLKEVVLPKSIISIGNEVFANGSSIGKVAFAEGGKSIEFGEKAFLNCKALVEVSLPSTIEELPLGMFEGCISLKGIYVDDNNPYFKDENGTVYSKNGDIIYYYSLRNGNITLPDTVTTIMGGVFKGNVFIDEFTFGENITSIGKEAFADCTTLKTITFSSTNALTVGENVFSGCLLLNNVTIPEQMTEIADGMFRGCVSLKNIVLHDAITAIGDYGLAYTGATLNSLPASLVALGDYALAYTGLTSATVSENFTTLGKYTFQGCSELTSFDLTGTKVTAIPDGCFKGTGLTEIYIPKTVTVIGTRAFAEVQTLSELEFEQGDGEDLIIGSQVAFNADESWNFFSEYDSFSFAFTSIKEVVFPERLKIIGNGAFYACTQLEYADFSNTRLASIGGWAFSNCSELKGSGWDEDAEWYKPLIFPETLQDVTNYTVALGEGAFDCCCYLYYVQFKGAEEGYNPQGTLSISKYAFNCAGCNNDDGAIYGDADYNPVVFPSNVNFIYTCYDHGSISDWFSYYAPPFTFEIAQGASNKYYINNGAVYSADKSILYTANTKSGTFTIPKEVKRIENRAVKGSATKVVFEAGGTEDLVIGEYAFSSVAKKLTELKLPSDRSVSIGANAFQYLEKITNLVIPKTVVSITSYSFAYSKFTSITFETDEEGNSALTNIGWYAFANCSQLTSVHFPKSLTSITEGAFSNCANLKDVTFADDSKLEAIGNGAFSATKVEEIVLPATVNQLGQRPFGTTLKKVTLSDELSDITEAFSFYKESTLGVLYTGNAYDSNVVEVIVPETNKYLKNGVKTVSVSDEESGETTTEEVADTRVVYSKDGTNLVYFAQQADATGFVMADTVTTIYPYAFYKVTLESVTISADIISIGKYAFRESNIETLTFAPRTKNLEIGKMAFYKNKMVGTLEIPESVVEIGDGAFMSCNKVTAVTFGQKSLLRNIGNYAFRGTKIETITIPNSVESFGTAFYEATSLKTIQFAPNNNSLTNIADYAFYGTALESIELPNNIYSIGEYAFYNTNITEINFPQYVTVVGEGAFANTGISSVTIPGTVGKLPASMFEGCSNLSSVTIKEGAEEIGDNAFNGCSILESITIPNTVSSVGNSAFENCSLLGEVNLSSNLESIGNKAFKGCIALESINIPMKVKTLGANAFDGCKNLKDVGLSDGVQTIGDYAFQNCINLESLVIPASVKVLGLNPFAGCTKFAGMEIAEGNDYYVIEDGILYNYEKTKIVLFPVNYTGEYEMPNTITEVESGLFANSKLTKVTVSASITKLPANVFKGSKQLTEVILHAGITSIGGNAFQDCTALTSIKSVEEDGVKDRLPSQLREIGSYAFSNVALTSVEIPGAVAKIGTYAFYNSSKLTDLTFEANGKEQLQIPDYAFYGTRIEDVVLPFRVRHSGSTVAVGQLAFGANPQLKTFAVENAGDSAGLDPYFTLGSNVFSGCTNLVTVSLPKHLGSPVFEDYDGDSYMWGRSVAIGSKAFSEYTKYNSSLKKQVRLLDPCTSLKTVTIDENTANYYVFASSVFEYCTNLETINLPTNLALGELVFANTGLTSVTLPANPDFINGQWSWLFSNCEQLEEVKFADCSANGKWTSLPSGLFIGCTALKTITIPDSITYIDSTTFNGCGALVNINVSENNKSFKVIDGHLYNKAGTKLVKYAGGTDATSYTIPTSVTTIEVGAFTNCMNLTSILVADGHTKFSSVDGNLYSADGKTLLAYASGKADEEFTVPSTVTTIGTNAFWGANNLKTVHIGKSVTTINQYAFAKMEGMEYIYLPSTVTTIGYRVFFGNEAHQTILCEPKSRPNKWSQAAFTERTKVTVKWGQTKPVTESDDTEQEG